MDLPFDISSLAKGLFGKDNHDEPELPQRGVSLHTTLVAVLISTKIIFPPLLKLIGLPPLVVLQRRIRPYLHCALYKKLGYGLPEFDFGCPGVTSMSCDTHKYGYASKGTSVVLFRNKELRRCAYFSYPQWTGGLYMYATPSIAGSRSGALLACAWASMVSLGEEGYMSRVERIMETTQYIAKEVASISGLYLLGGKPKAMIVCFGSKDSNIYRVGDAISKRGWSLNTLQRPACLHLCVTLATIPHADKFIEELRSVVAEVRKDGNDGKETGNAAIYGLAGSLPPGPVATLLKCYTDAVLTP